MKNAVRFGSQSIINSDRWKAKYFQFYLANFVWHGSREQRDCAKSYFSPFKSLRVIMESDKVSIYSFHPNYLIFCFKSKPLRFSNSGQNAYSLRLQIARYIKSKIVIEVKLNEVKEADEGWSRFGFGNPQPSGPRRTPGCVNNLYPLTLISLPCGMLCLCACVKSPFKGTDFLSFYPMFHVV